MNSMTMAILGGRVQAAMKSTTLGCLSAVITRTSSWKFLAISLDTESVGIILTATAVVQQIEGQLADLDHTHTTTIPSVPFHMAL